MDKDSRSESEQNKDAIIHRMIEKDLKKLLQNPLLTDDGYLKDKSNMIIYDENGEALRK